MKRAMILIFGLVAIFLPLAGYGAGFQVYVEQGAAALGMGAAFVAKADNPTAVFFNPAGITQLKGTQITLNYTAGLLDSKLKGARNPFATNPNEPAHENMDDNWAQIPSSISPIRSIKSCLLVSVFSRLTGQKPIGTTVGWDVTIPIKLT